MNTTDTNTPLLKLTRMREYVFVLEDLELAFPKSQLENITILWNNGFSIEELSKKFKRDPDEIFLALFHQARFGKTTRPFDYVPKKKKRKV